MNPKRKELLKSRGWLGSKVSHSSEFHNDLNKSRVKGMCTDPRKEYERGNTELIVSELALGTMQFGGKMNMGNLGQEDTTWMVRVALNRGINFIDTADVYSLGESESLVGNALRGVR